MNINEIVAILEDIQRKLRSLENRLVAVEAKEAQNG